jgi:hypothetical protein
MRNPVPPRTKVFRCAIYTGNLPRRDWNRISIPCMRNASPVTPI